MQLTFKDAAYQSTGTSRILADGVVYGAGGRCAEQNGWAPRRNPLKGALGDALHAVMCVAEHNLRLNLAAPRLYCTRFGLPMQWAIAALAPRPVSANLPVAENGIVQCVLFKYRTGSGSPSGLWDF
ncbi:MULTISPECIES: hypothetical protein [Delftia]|uniref:hypothetical protein n=1 Tax=Delftia TaxID=80865 RepID=UPI001141C6F9|nr:MULTISPECIES: hypothetical protein [Delftia]